MGFLYGARITKFLGTAEGQGQAMWACYFHASVVV